MSQPDLSSFAKYIPGFEFLQNLTRQAAAGAVPEMQSGVPGMPSLSHWVAPTFDVEELDKRIQDLKAVHFWLDQNTKALSATIQALEVQRMTLATLKNMNLSLSEVADAFKMKVPEPVASPAEPEPAAEEPAQAEQEQPAVDPMLWWNALTQQFQDIAGNVVRDMADQATRAAEQMAQTVQAGAEAAGQMASASETPAPAPKKAARRPASKSSKPKAPRAATAKPSGQPTAGRKTAVKAPARKRAS